MLTVAEEQIEKEKLLREELDTLVPELARLLGLEILEGSEYSSRQITNGTYILEINNSRPGLKPGTLRITAYGAHYYHGIDVHTYVPEGSFSKSGTFLVAKGAGRIAKEIQKRLLPKLLTVLHEAHVTIDECRISAQQAVGVAEELSQASGGTIKHPIEASRGRINYSESFYVSTGGNVRGEGEVRVSSDVATVSMKLFGLSRDLALKIAELLREA
jgi:hypothetical protein